ncbi:uncharacterized protein LOC120431781 [Culex pipiens pallens]|uniref:uncharacterized protein LOC120431781 n=1 Tax=Culex pipiens pallens TaxID=42434 RepID=UPI001952D765|nr:uncharacterized protein LOC120431781 [Culex pipiens pallens]
MKPATTTFFLVALAVLGHLPAESGAEQQMNLQLERFEQIDGADLIDSSKLRVRKYNRTAFVLDGTVELFIDLDNAYEVTVKVAYSTLGNNQFNEYPMKLPRKSICAFMVDEYVEYQYIWADSTNLPHVEKGTEEFCPFPKGEYWFKELVPDSSFLPPVIPAGLWRMTWEFLRPNDEVVMQLRFFYRVTKGKTK